MLNRQPIPVEGIPAGAVVSRCLYMLCNSCDTFDGLEGATVGTP